MSWGSDPLVSPQSQTAISSQKSGWGKDPLMTPGNDKPVITPAEHFADAAVSASDPALSEIFQGATLGLGDKIDAGLGYVTTAIGNAAGEAIGNKPKFSASDAYGAMLAAEGRKLSEFEQNHPIAATGLNILGGFMSPGAKQAGELIRGGETVASRLVRGAGIGGAYSGIAGFASGSHDLTDRMSNAMWGIPFGAALGLGFTGAGEIAGPLSSQAGKLARALGSTFKQAFKVVSGKTPQDAINEFSPKELKQYEDMALGYVKDLMRRSGKTTSQLTEDSAYKMRKPVTSAEAIGRVGINQLASISRRAGTTPDIVESEFRQRTEATPERIQADLAKAAGADPSAIEANFDKLSNSLRQKADPLYQKAYADPAPDVQNNEALKNLLQRPSIKKAIVRAREIAAEEGRNPDSIAVGTKFERHLSSMLDAHGRPIYHDIPTDFDVKNPTMQTWDYIKRGLQTVINREHKDALGRLQTDDPSRAVLGTLKELREELFRISPAYKEAVAAGGEPLQLEDAYKSAPKLMHGNISEKDFAGKMEEFTPAQREAFKGGWVNDVFEKIRAGSLKLKDLKSDNFRTKSRMLLGWNNADEFISRVEQEQRLLAAASRIMPGRQSITGELMESGKEFDEEASDLHKAAIRTVHSGWRTAVEDYIADKAYKLFRASRTPGNEQLRNEVGRLLRTRPDVLQKMLDQTGSQILGQKSSPTEEILTTLGIPVSSARIDNGPTANQP